VVYFFWNFEVENGISRLKYIGKEQKILKKRHLGRRRRRLRRLATTPPSSPTAVPSRRRRWVREEREEREPRVWEGKREKDFEKWKKMGLKTLIYPLLTRPVFFLNRPSSRPNTFSAFISAQLSLFFSCLLHTPHSLLHPPCIHLFYSHHIFLRIFTLIIFFRCILCLVRLCIFILLLKHP